MLSPSFIKNNLTKMIPRCRKIAHSKISPGLHHIFSISCCNSPFKYTCELTNTCLIPRFHFSIDVHQVLPILTITLSLQKKFSHLHLMKQYIKWKYLSSSIVWASSNVVLFDNIWYEIRAEKLGQIIFLWAKSELLHSC